MNEITGNNCFHLCIDMQEMFAQQTDWHAPWLSGVLPAVEAIADRHPARTIFTRFIPPERAEDATGAWKSYYQRWGSMTRAQMPPGLIDLVPSLRRYVPPAQVVDKPVYSPWMGTDLHAQLRDRGAEALVITGGETDVCVLAAVMGAIDLGYRVVIASDAVFSSADATHDATLGIYSSRFGQQLTVCKTQELLDDWSEVIL